eukprot:scaffold2353_cov167-Amphora_coffeaeformis.AAC.65
MPFKYNYLYKSGGRSRILILIVTLSSRYFESIKNIPILVPNFQQGPVKRLRDGKGKIIYRPALFLQPPPRGGLFPRHWHLCWLDGINAWSLNNRQIALSSPRVSSKTGSQLRSRLPKCH